MAVNQFNAGNLELDGDKGKFVRSLGSHEANSFQVATADGKLLGTFTLNGVNGDGFPEFEAALNKWKALPQAQRAPRTLKLDGGKRDSAIEPPPGGLVLRVYTRNLKRDAKGQPARITPKDLEDRKAFPQEDWAWGEAIYAEPMPDVLWLTEAEWKSLVPASPRKGDAREVPAPVRMRIFRYHLVNSTFGLAPAWMFDQVRSGKLTLTVEEVAPLVRLRLDGAALLSDDPDPDKAAHGFDAQLGGTLVYDPKQQKITRFDFVAVGDYWGGDMENGLFARPGRTPLGVAFELAQGRSAAELVAPKGSAFEDLKRFYFAAEKPGDFGRE